MLLEADPPQHDAPRRVLAGCSGPARCGGCGAAGRAAPTTWSTGCWPKARVRRGPRAGRSLPAARLPRRRRHPRTRAARTCCPTATTVQRVRPGQRPRRQGRAAGRGAVGLGQRAVPAGRRWRRTGSAPQIWAAADRGDITPGAGAAGGPLAAVGRGGHDRARARRRAATPSRPTPTSGGGCARAAPGPGGFRRGGAVGLAGPDVLPHRDHRRPRRGRRHPGRREDPHVPGRRQPRPPPLGRTRTRSTSAGTRRDTSGSVSASTSASASTSPGSRPRPADRAGRGSNDRDRRADDAAPQQHAAGVGGHPAAGGARLTRPVD